MKRCPLGHENPDDASRCQVCLARFVVLPVSLALVGVPEVPVTVLTGRRSLVVVGLSQSGGVGRTCTISVAGDATAWAGPEQHEVAIGPGEAVDVRLLVEPPDGTPTGLWSLAVRVVGEPDEAPADAELLLQVLEAEPTPEPAPPEPTPAPAPPPTTVHAPDRPWLELETERYPLSRDETVLGRDHDVDIVLDDPGVSRRHLALLVRRDGTDLVTTLEDLGSTNGTYVNGERVTVRRLRAGDRITLGRTDLTFGEGRR